MVLALALLASAGLAGCGFGPGDDRGSAGLVVTSDYGRDVLIDQPVDGLTESSTALRILDDSAEVETRYGGGFVQAVDGLSGGSSEGRRSDWFYSVNGVVAGRGAADFPVGHGDRVWWDYRDWSDATEVGAVVGSFPAPMAGGYDGLIWPVRVECLEVRNLCGKVKSKLEAAGAELAPGPSHGQPGDKDEPEAIQFMVGSWNELGTTPEGRRLNRGPSSSGVFARFEIAIPPAPAGASKAPGPESAAPVAIGHLIGLNDRAEAVQDYGPEAGLVAAMRRGESPPVWLVTGGSIAGVKRAVAILDQAKLENRYAAIAVDRDVESLPLP